MTSVAFAGRPNRHLATWMMNKINPRWTWLGVAALLACQSAPPRRSSVNHYLATERTIDVGVGPGLCVAVDLSDPSGVWWWEPGRTECTSRSTGPSVFPADSAKVTRSSSGAIDVSFEIQLKTGPPRQVRLEVHEDHMRELPSGRRVSAERRATLDLRESPLPIAWRER